MTSFLVVFPDPWLAYSPSADRMIRALGLRGTVSVMAPTDDRFYEPELPGIEWIPLGKTASESGIVGILGLQQQLFCLRMSSEIRKARRKRRWSFCIAIDSASFHAARMNGLRPAMLSLEVRRDLPDLLTRATPPRLLLTQNQVRKELLLGNTPTRWFKVPNMLPPELYCVATSPTESIELYYSGTIIPGHAVHHFSQSLRFLPENYSLRIQGPAPIPSYLNAIIESSTDLLKTGRLTINTEYVPADRLPEQGMNSHIGLCCYDFRYIRPGDLNYRTVPSGKLNHYLLTGLPVLIDEATSPFHGDDPAPGICIPSPTPQSVARGVMDIVDSYSEFKSIAAMQREKLIRLDQLETALDCLQTRN